MSSMLNYYSIYEQSRRWPPLTCRQEFECIRIILFGAGIDQLMCHSVLTIDCICTCSTMYCYVQQRLQPTFALYHRSITIASKKRQIPDITMLSLFGFGSIVLRGVACTVNDLLDRDIDKKVTSLLYCQSEDSKLRLSQSSNQIKILLLPQSTSLLD